MSLTTDGGTWLSRDVWEDRDHAHFAARAEAFRYGLFSSPVMIRHGSRDPRPITQRWILRGKAAPNQPVNSGPLLAWAELQGFHRLFDVFWLFVGPHSLGWGHPDATEAARALVSGILLSGGSDLLRVAPAGNEPPDELFDALTTEVRALTPTSDSGSVDRGRIWTPRHGFLDVPAGVDAGRSIPTALIDPRDWWQTPTGDRHRTLFAYVAGQYNPHPTPPPSARRPSWIASMFQLGKWRV